MWIRSAFWLGQPRPGTEQQFEQLLNDMAPAMSALPGVQRARAWWPRTREDSPPPVACQFVVEFASRADLERMLASPERAALRPRVLALRELFDGHMSHIEYETGD